MYTGLKKEELDREIYWAAGFYEGEGSCGERAVIVSQQNKWPLERLASIFGGYITYPNKKDRCWQWSASGEEARIFIDCIYPHLSPVKQAFIDKRFVRKLRFRPLLRSDARRAFKDVIDYLKESTHA